MSNFITFLPSLSTAVMQMTTYPKLNKKKQLINRPTDLGVLDLGKQLIKFYTKIITNGPTMMKKSEMNEYIDLFGHASADEYFTQLSYQQMRGFIKKFMNVLKEKNHKYHGTIGCILGDWVLRVRPKYFKIDKTDIFHEIPIEVNLRKIPKSARIFKKVFIALKRQCHVIPP